MQQLLELLDKTQVVLFRLVTVNSGFNPSVSQTPRRIAGVWKNIVKVYASLATLGLKDLIDEVGKVKADKHWKAHIQLLKEYRTCNRNSPHVPSRTAGLPNGRVQLAGPSGPLGCGSLLEIKWDWENRAGVGCHPQACPWGTNLIVAPTSVCMNWVRHNASPYPQYRSIWWERSPTTTQQLTTV